MRNNMKISHFNLHTFEGEAVQKGVQTSKGEQNSQIINNSTDFVNGSQWMSIREAVQRFCIKKRTLIYRCETGKYNYRMTNGNGGKQYSINVNSIIAALPMAEKLKFYKENTELQSASVSHSNNTHPASSHGSETAPPERGIKSNNLSDKQREIALAKYDIIRLYNQALSSGNFGNLLSIKESFTENYNNGSLPEILEKLGPCKYRTFDRWKSQLETNNNDPLALAPQYKKDRGSGVSTDVSKVLIKNALSPNRPLINEVIRTTRKELNARDIPCDSSDRTLRRFIIKWKKKHYAEWTFMRDGSKALNDKVMPYLERDYDSIRVGDVVVADGHVLNFDILNPATGKPKRMTLILVIDMKSNFPLGWEIMPTENTLAIASAYRRAILMLGIVPKVFYLDNGRAFRAKYFKGVHDFKTSGITGLFERWGCLVTHAWAFHGQSKTVEPFFGYFSEMERRSLTYTGTSIEKKPARLMRNEKFHIKLHNQLTSGATPTIKEAHYQIAYWMAEYIEREQQQGHLKGQTPLQVFEAEMNELQQLPEYRQRQISKDELNYLMMEQQVKTLYRNGIKYMNRFYFDQALFSHEKGRGNYFKIKYDLENEDSVLVYSIRGDFICEAFRTDKIHAMAKLGSAEDQEKLQAAIEKKRGYEKDVRGLANAFLEHVQEHTPASASLSHPSQEGNQKELNVPQLGTGHEDPKPLRVPVPALGKYEPDYGQLTKNPEPKAKKKYFIFDHEKEEAELAKAAGGE